MFEARAHKGRNRLLNLLEAASYQELSTELETVNITAGQALYEPHEPIEYVYFPLDSVVSILAHLEEDNLIEVATVGNEGMVGLPLFLGANTTPGTALSQVPGKALRMPAKNFRRVIESSAPLAKILHRYSHALMVQIAQGNACNRVHSIEERCARWLLLCHDQTGGKVFLLTQEFLGRMLGVRRAGVNLVAASFQRAGFIKYSRGHVSVLNRLGLESASCRCYFIIRDEYERMLENQPWASLRTGAG
jgi:CRP-like cAMP-binding protein